MKTSASRVCVSMLLLAACGRDMSPTQPSASGASPSIVLSLEGEAGNGDGEIVQRFRASGGLTVHLGPSERREWTLDVSAAQVQYALSVTYSNSRGGDNEVLTVSVDGVAIRTFQNRDSGENAEGWDMFVTDPAGVYTLVAGEHTIALDVSGGDGCVEIDLMTLAPPGTDGQI